VVARLASIGQVRLAVRDREAPLPGVLDLGPARRLFTKRQCQALVRSGDTCVYPGCRNQRHLEAHHVRH
jgi:hypothetical protein